MQTRPAWEQLSDETPKAYAAFSAYRNLPTQTRSIDTAWRRQRASELDATRPDDMAELQRLPHIRASAIWRNWSAKYAWVARAMAWDTEKDRIAREQLVKDHKAMLDKHRTLGGALVQKAAERLMSLAGSDLKVHDIPSFLRAGVAIERQAFDLPDVVVQHSGQVGVDASVEHSSPTYDAIVRLLLDAPDEAILAADRLSGRLAASSALPRADTEPREAPKGAAS
jgi:hypothetical protein